MRIAFFQQCLPFDFQLHDAPFDLIDLYGQRINLHAQACRGFIDQVDGFIRKEAVRDVTVGKRGRRDNRRVFDAHAMMHFVAFLQPA